jgi:hypothetical protein
MHLVSRPAHARRAPCVMQQHAGHCNAVQSQGAIDFLTPAEKMAGSAR